MRKLLPSDHIHSEKKSTADVDYSYPHENMSSSLKIPVLLFW